MTMDYDSWLMSGYEDSLGEPGIGEQEFTMKLRGGTVNVNATTSIEKDGDEDGEYNYMAVKINSVTWTFHPDADVDMTSEEEKEVAEEVKERAGDE